MHILSGFLGSGKTTLLNRLLKTPEFANTLVIINEFGDVALDHLLVEKSTDSIIELSNGCLCCSIRGELVETLHDVANLDVERIVIETTGIADPLPVMQSITAHPNLAAHFKLASTLVVFDLVRGEEIFAANEEARRQLALGDLILFTKADLLNSPDRETAIKRTKRLLANIAPSANFLDSKDCSSISSKLLDTVNAPEARGTIHATAHDKTYKSVTLRSEEPFPGTLIERFIDNVFHNHGDNILRIKGLVQTTEQPTRPMVLQVSGKLIHPVEYLEKWPQETAETVLVVIVQNMDPSLISRVFDSFSGKIAVDTPDFDTIENNPLAIPGFNSS